MTARMFQKSPLFLLGLYFKGDSTYLKFGYGGKCLKREICQEASGIEYRLYNTDSYKAKSSDRPISIVLYFLKRYQTPI